MRRTAFFIPTLKEKPANAQIPSHELMLRAGLIRMIAAGLYTYLPLGLLALRKVESIVREEMDRIGAQEFAFTTLVPKELWEVTGRWHSMQDDLLSTQLSIDSHCVLAPTHEESFTDFAVKHIFSYNQLPINLYQITSKFRNEKRPRYGVMRSKEFLMKDAYSFHMNDECLHKTYQDVSGAYTKIFDRCGLEHYIVEADSGTMGGSASQEFVVLNPFGENTISFCNHCKVASNVEAASEHFSAPPNSSSLGELQLLHTPGKKSAEEVTDFLQISADRIVKAMLYEIEDGNICMVLLRADRHVNESKLFKALQGKKFQIANHENVEKVLGAPMGYWGPVFPSSTNISIMLVDQSVKTVVDGFIGANKLDYHYKNFSLQRDVQYPYSWEDVSEVVQGSICGKCQKGTLLISKGIELGHIFKLGLKYSKAFDMKITKKSGEKDYPTMGCYGIGINRLLAAIIEQHHDKKGIVWPANIAPFQVNLVTLGDDPSVIQQSKIIYETLQRQGYSVLWDDRDESAGFKLADCDLLGCPYQVLVGTKFAEEGFVEVRDRRTKESQDVKLDAVFESLKKVKKT